MSSLEQWRRRARRLKQESYALYLAARDPRVPWYARLLVACVVAYALSPIDLIPDTIPVLGYLDDLVLLPLGIALARRLIPSPVLRECRARAALQSGQRGPASRAAALVIVLSWLLLALLMLRLML